MTDQTSLISIPLAAARTGLPVDAFVAEALRRHDEIPIFVQPDPPGWRAVLHQADPRSRVPIFEEHYPSDIYDIELVDPILLTPDVLREVMTTNKLHRVTIDAMPIGTVREEIGYTAWTISADGTVDFEPSSAVSRSYVESYVLCEAQQIPLGSLLVPKSALDHLRAHPQADATTENPVASASPSGVQSLWTVPEVAEYLGVSEVKARARIKDWAPYAPGLLVDLGPRSARVDPVILREHLAGLGGRPAQPDAAAPPENGIDNDLFDLMPLRRTPR